MAAQRDLWGDIVPDVMRTPVGIMREQAALLGDKTQHLIEAEVATAVEQGDFTHSFDLRVPALDNYRYRLFTIEHGPEIYPVKLRPYYSKRVFQTEDEFVTWLGEKLSSPETRHLINNLVSQAQS